MFKHRTTYSSENLGCATCSYSDAPRPATSQLYDHIKYENSDSEYNEYSLNDSKLQFRTYYFFNYIPGGKGQPSRKLDNLTGICEPII
jgi:hypothetical protein